MSQGNGKSVEPLTADQLEQLVPLSAGDYYAAKTRAPKDGNGDIGGEDFAFHALAHAAYRKGLVEADDVFAFLDRVNWTDLTALAEVIARQVEPPAGPLAKTRTTSSRRSVTSGG